MPKSISISQFRQHGMETLGGDMIDSLQDDLIITSNSGYKELFNYPCRLDAITMLICKSGTINGNVNLKGYSLEANDVFVCLPGDIMQINKINQLDAYTIIISGALLNELQIDIQKLMPLYLGIRHNPTVKVTEREYKLLEHYYGLAHDVIQSNDENAREIIKGLLVAFVYQVISFINLHVDSLQDPHVNGELRRNNYLFDRFMLLLKEHHTTQRGLSFYANELCLTPKYLSRIIKDVSGKSAAEWIDDYVILEAKNLLKFTDMSVQQVAYHLNFSSQSAFGKYFKQQTGMPPKIFIAQ